MGILTGIFKSRDKPQNATSVRPTLKALGQEHLDAFKELLRVLHISI